MPAAFPQIERDLDEGLWHPFSFNITVSSTDPWVRSLLLIGTNNSVSGTVMIHRSDGALDVRSSQASVPEHGGEFTVGGHLNYTFIGSGRTVCR